MSPLANGFRPARLGRAVALLLAWLCAPACDSTPRVTIDGEDDSVFFGSGGVRWDITPGEPQAASAPCARTGEQAVEVEKLRVFIGVDVTEGSGDFTQHVGAGEAIQIGGEPFFGPEEVDVDVQLWTVDLAVRIERRWPNRLGLGGGGGFRFSELDISLKSDTQHEDEDLSALGFVVGAEVFYEPVDPLRLFVAGNTSWSVPVSTYGSYVYEDVIINTLDIGLAWTVHRHVRLVGAWHHAEYRIQSTSDYLSDLDFDLSGPLLGLWVTF